MHATLQKLLAACLLFCLLFAPAQAEEPSLPEDRYAMTDAAAVAELRARADRV